MNPDSSQSSPLLPKILLGLVFLSVLLAAFLGFDDWSSREKIENLQTQNAQIEQQIDRLETEGEVGNLFEAKQILERASADRVIWSEVTKNLLALETTTEDLLFKQIKVAPDGSVVIGGGAESLKSVAILLQKVRETDLFADPFVPSVNGEAGVYNFQLQFTYLGL